MALAERCFLVVRFADKASIEADKCFRGNVADRGGAEVVDRNAGLRRKVPYEPVSGLTKPLQVSLGELVGLRVLAVEIPQTRLVHIRVVYHTPRVRVTRGLNAQHDALRKAVVLRTDQKVRHRLLNHVLQTHGTAGEVRTATLQHRRVVRHRHDRHNTQRIALNAVLHPLVLVRGLNRGVSVTVGVELDHAVGQVNVCPQSSVVLAPLLEGREANPAVSGRISHDHLRRMLTSDDRLVTVRRHHPIRLAELDCLGVKHVGGTVQAVRLPNRPRISVGVLGGAETEALDPQPFGGGVDNQRHVIVSQAIQQIPEHRARERPLNRRKPPRKMMVAVIRSIKNRHLRPTPMKAGL